MSLNLRDTLYHDINEEFIRILNMVIASYELAFLNLSQLRTSKTRRIITNTNYNFIHVLYTKFLKMMTKFWSLC